MDVEQEKKEIEKLENEIKTLEQEKAPLDEQSYHLHCKAITTTYKLDKDRIMAEKAEIYPKLTQLQNTIDGLREKQAIPKLIKLWKENRHIIKVVNNGNRIEIPEDLDAVIAFDGCDHTLKMPVYELLRYQTTMDTNTKLLNAWEIAVRNGNTITRSMLCDICMKEKKKKAEEQHLIQPSKRTGTAMIQIVIFK